MSVPRHFLSVTMREVEQTEGATSSWILATAREGSSSSCCDRTSAMASCTSVSGSTHTASLFLALMREVRETETVQEEDGGGNC